MNQAQPSAETDAPPQIALSQPIEPQGGMPTARLISGTVLILAAVVLLVWRGSLEGPFHFDDENLLTSAAVTNPWDFSKFAANNRPFGLWTFALNHAVSGFDARAFHITNLLIHTANVLMLFTGIFLTGTQLLLRSQSRWTAAQWLAIAFCTALLWGLHPMTTQAVTYIVQRYESLATTGFLTAWLGWLLVIGRRRAVGLALIAIGMWCGLMTKEIVATAPLVLVLFDRAFFSATWRELFRHRGMALAIACTPLVWFVPSVARWLRPGSRSTLMGFGMEAASSWDYLRTQPEVLLRYLKLATWPTDLCFDYAWTIQVRPEVYLPLGLLIVIALGFFVWCYGRGCRARMRFNSATVGWLGLSFFLVLGPTSSFVPINDFCVEHRMYLPLMFVTFAACLIAFKAYEATRSRGHRAILCSSFISVVVVAAVMTVDRNRDYESALVLWRKTFTQRPQNPRAAFMYGRELADLGYLADAERLMLYASRTAPKSVTYQVGLGQVALRRGDDKEAIEYFDSALSVAPDSAAAHHGLAEVAFRRSEYEVASKAFAKAADFGMPLARYNQGVALAAAGLDRKATAVFDASLNDNPRYQPAILKLAWILSTSPDDTVRDGSRALSLLEGEFGNRPTEDWATLEWPVVDAYTAALADSGSFDLAAEVLAKKRRSVERAGEGNNESFDDTLVEIERRHERYQSGQPWRAKNLGEHESQPLR